MQTNDTKNCAMFQLGILMQDISYFINICNIFVTFFTKIKIIDFFDGNELQ